MKALQTICDLSPVPIHFYDEKKLNKRLGNKFGSGVYGRFVYRYPKAKKFKLPWKPPFIMVDDSLEDYKKAAVVLHEMKHSFCLKAKCECRRDALSNEAHAFWFTLEELRERNLKRSLFWTMEKIAESAHYCDDPEFMAICGLMVNSPPWKKSAKFLGERYSKYIKENKGVAKSLAEWKRHHRKHGTDTKMFVNLARIKIADTRNKMGVFMVITFDEKGNLVIT